MNHETLLLKFASILFHQKGTGHGKDQHTRVSISRQVARIDHVIQVGNSAARFLPHHFQQIEAADKKMFTLLAEKTRGGIKAGPNEKPCDVHFEACMD